MGYFTKAAFAGVFFAISGLVVTLPAHADDLIPATRFVLTENTDSPGGDITSIFDTTLEACERACQTNKSCTTFVFNTRNNSCFPKTKAGEPVAFQGAYSGTILRASKGAEKLAQSLRGDLPFVPDYEIYAATQQAASIGNMHVTNGYTAQEHADAAAQAETNGDLDGASRFAGASVALSDSADGWMEYGRLLLAASKPSSNDQSAYRDRSYNALINAYLRTDAKPQRHSILVMMGEVLEDMGRGRDTVQALRLAQSLQKRDDTAKLLDDAIGKYGFRIADNEVQADRVRPRICVNFTEDLLKTGVNYADYVQLPSAGLTVSSDGYRQICVEGVEHGSRQTITFREGLPAADGQTLAKSIDITAYVRDRTPTARFPGRGYVLPRTGEASIPIETVNTEALDLTLYHVTDRNLLRTIQNGYFNQAIDQYSDYVMDGEVGTEIWTGSAKVKQEINADITTRLPLDEAIKGRPAGIYALRAEVPGSDPDSNPAAWQWFAVSDLGLTTMSGSDGLHVFVRSLGTAGAKEGLKVQLLSSANEVLGEATTDAIGYAHFEAGLTRGTGGAAPALVIVRDGTDDIAFLSLTDPEFDLSDRGVEGREAAPPVDVFLTTDRGAYRTGETVYATALARDPQAEAVTGLPLTAVLYRPDGVEYSRQLVQDNGAGGHVFQLPLAGGAPRGTWRLEIQADKDAGALTSTSFLVADFLPERIDFDLSLADGPIRLGDSPDLTVNAKYLFGAPGADLAVEGEVRLRAAGSLEAWPNFSFGRYDAPFSSETQSFGDIKTEADGSAVIPLELPSVDDPKRPLEMTVTTRVAEGSGRPVERQISKLLTPDAPMIGIKAAYDGGVVAEGQKAKFSVVAVGPDSKAMPMKVVWKLNRIDVNYQWYQSDGRWNWEPVTTRTPISDGVVDLGAAPSEVSADVDWGQYELTVEQAEGGDAASSTSFYAGWYVPADTSATPDTLELSLDKKAYKPGETAMLRVVPRAAGTALVTVMSNHLIAMKAVEVKEGENLIPLEVTDQWGAGVYVTASVLRPMDVAAGRNSSRALGLTYASIDPGAHALKASIETAPEAAPRGPLDVAVKVDGVEAGDTAYVTVAAVDQGILNLTGFKAPDPAAYYFGQQKLGMGIRDIYGRLIDPMNGVMGEVRSGGDAGAQARLQAPPPTEELVAYFAGPVEVGADGYARTSFKLPSFNGTVKIMAIAWSKKGIGQANADVLVRDPVVVTASLPRFMAPGDESRVLLEIVHATGPSGRMGLDLVGHGVTLGDAPSGFDLGDKAKVVFAIPVKAEGVGKQSIDVNLTTPDGKLLTKTLMLPVQVNDPPVVHVSRLDLAKGKSFTLDENAFADMIPGTAKVTMAAGPIARLNAPGILATLDRYPYGCTEQLTSKALPLLYFDQVATALDLSGGADIHKRIEETIPLILMNQDSNGAFGLWSPSSGDFWLDAFVTDFLSRAKARGYDVPDKAFRSALDNLRNQVNYQPDFDKGDGQALAYALMVLAREGAAAIGDLRYYADVKGDAFGSPMAQAQLGAALASYGDQPRADAMFRKAVASLQALRATKAEQIFRADYGTDFRDTAAVLTLAVEAGSNAVDREALSSSISTNRALSTQEATWSLLAANALIDRAGADGLMVDGAPAQGPLVRVLDANSTTPVVVKNDGKADTTLTITTYGVPKVPEPAGGTGYAITRSYYTPEGQPQLMEDIKVGTRMVVVLDVTPFGRGEARLMVNDPLPAGFEIDNPALMSSGSTAGMDWLTTETDVANTEFRQDRFLTAIDRYDDKPFQLAYIVRAISPGKFHQPAASVEDMYRPDLVGHTDASTITIGE